MTHPLLIVIEETSQRRGKFSAHLLDGRTDVILAGAAIQAP